MLWTIFAILFFAVIVLPILKWLFMPVKRFLLLLFFPVVYAFDTDFRKTVRTDWKKMRASWKDVKDLEGKKDMPWKWVWIIPSAFAVLMIAIRIIVDLNH